MNNESADETITPEKPVQLNEEDLQKQEVSFSSRQYIIIVILIVLFFLALVSIIMDYMIPGLIFFLAHSIGFVIFYYNDTVQKNIALSMSGLQNYTDHAGGSNDTITLHSANEEDSALLLSFQEKCRQQVTEIQELRDKLSKYDHDAESSKQQLDSLKKSLETDTILPEIKVSNNFDPVNIITIARQVVGDLRLAAEKAGISIMVSSGSDTILVKADPTRINILFRNIVDNSIKYMQRAGSLIITISSIGDDIFIVLKDNGNGLSENEAQHIFELNYQGSNRISGNGLGLAQARAIVNSYGGTIYAKSTVGKGMGIYIQLPTN